MSVTVGAAGRRAQAEALAQVVAGGVIYFCLGRRPSMPDDVSVPEAQVAVRLPISRVALDGEDVRIAAPATPVHRAGVVRWFRVLTPSGAAVLDGDVGLTFGDFRLARTELLVGDTLVVDELTLRPEGVCS